MRYAGYIEECRSVDGVETKKIPAMLYISRDRYHLHATEVEAKINELAKILDGRAHVIYNDIGNETAAAGLALKNLDRSKLLEIPQGRKAKQQIAIHDATHKPACMLYESFPLRRPDQVIVQCPVALTTRGNLVGSSIAGAYEYFAEDDPDNIICHVSNTDSIYDAIFAYNTVRLDCFDYQISFLNNPEIPGRMKLADGFQTKKDNLDKQLLRQEPEEDKSIFPIPESLSKYELKACRITIHIGKEKKKKERTGHICYS